MPGCKAEYKKRHDELWPEVATLLKKQGISDYSIFLDEETDTLFAVQYQTGSGSSQDMGDQEIIKKWWKYMADIMETHSDCSPVSKPLQLMFHMD